MNLPPLSATYTELSVSKSCLYRYILYPAREAYRNKIRYANVFFHSGSVLGVGSIKEPTRNGKSGLIRHPQKCPPINKKQKVLMKRKNGDNFPILHTCQRTNRKFAHITNDCWCSVSPISNIKNNENNINNMVNSIIWLLLLILRI